MATLDLERKVFHVKLVERGVGTTVVFDVTPDLTESQQVTYKSYDPVHMPGTIYVFGSSASRTFSINVKLVSRSSGDATRNLYIINTLRGWTKPRFGVGSSTVSGDQVNRRNKIKQAGSGAGRATLNNQYQKDKREGRITGSIYGTELLGAPPAVLRLSAYALPDIGTTKTLKGIIDRVPVVITSLTIPYPSDPDYILTAAGEDSTLSFIPAGVPVPTVATIDISLAETHSPREYSGFNLSRYRQGRLTGF